MVAIFSSDKLDREKQTSAAFDVNSGSLLELAIFNHRLLIIFICTVLTGLLSWSAMKISVNADYSAMLPESQSFVRNYEANKDNLRALGDSVRVVVVNKHGTIYDPKYLETLRQLNDRIFLLPGVDRSFMESLWTPVVRWTQVTEQGVAGGPVMPDDFDGSAATVNRLRENVQLAGITGSLVANDQQSSIIFVPLLNFIPATGQPFDYGAFWRDLGADIARLQSPSVQIHVVGFAAIMGTLIADLHEMIKFFFIAIAVAALFIYAFTRCVRSTILILMCSSIAVVWLLGIIRLLGYCLDPYSVLVPFLVFAIGVSHGAQKMNGIMQDIGRGTHRYVAARLTFRRLFVAGLTALAADAVGFAVLTVIDIQAIRALAMTASIGVSVLVFTNLVLLPILLSFAGVSEKAAIRSLETSNVRPGHGSFERVFLFLEHFCDRRWAIMALLLAAALTAAGFAAGRDVQIGDVKPGAPEFRADSAYNTGNSYVMDHYSLSSDQFAIIVKSPVSAGLANYQSILEMDRFGQFLRGVQGVQTTESAADFTRLYSAGNFQGNLKWWTISRDSYGLNDALRLVFGIHPELIDNDESAAPIIVYLTDHKARTLTSITKAAQDFANKNSTGGEQFLLAAGSAGMDAATNIVVARANLLMPYLVYAAVVLLCFLSFRTWRAVVVAIVPLLITSILCQALMVELGIGVKVATLPVVALGVGIGVDYALYLLSVQLAFQRSGESLRIAYSKALRFTGRIVVLVGCTLAMGVSIWAFSPIKFQADMGILLAFMFLWNMIGALVLIPALSCFLLQSSRVETKGTVAAVG